MPTVTGTDIIERAQTTLLDTTGVLWTVPELTVDLAAGINAIVTVKPDTFIKQANAALVAGAVQQIPDDGQQLVDVLGLVQIEKNYLNRTKPGWMTSTAGATLHFMTDKRTPKQYLVYPPAVADAVLPITYSAIPPRYTDPATVIPIDDIYENPLYYWLLACAYAKNAKRGDVAKMQSYLQLFSTAIGARTAVQLPFTPTPQDEAQTDETRNSSATVKP